MFKGAIARDATAQTSSSSNGAAPTTAEPAHLIDPVPGHPDADVPDLLRGYAQIPGLQDAVKAIFQLVDKAQIPSTITDASCQTAAFLLLELGQGRLLCVLAQDRPLDYQLNIGASDQKTLMLTVEQMAQVLARIAPSWPQSTPVTLTLRTSLSAEAVQALHPFLQRPTTLGVHVVVDDTPDEAPANGFAAALQLRTLSALSIECNASIPESLQVLDGAQAQAISIQIAKQPPQDQWRWFENGLTAIVSQSNATQLNVAHDSVPAPLATRLLSCRDHWFSADLSLDAYDNLLWTTDKGTLKIDRLNVHPTWKKLLVLTSRDVERLVKMGVGTLIFYGALDVTALGEALQAPVSTGGGPIRYIESSCVLQNGANFEKVLALLSDVRDVTVVVHRPASARVPGHRPITDDEAARLAALRSSNSSMAQAVKADLSQQHASELAWWGAIHAVGTLLLPHMRVKDVLHYLQSPDNKALPAIPTLALPDIPPDSFSVRDKTRLLQSWGASDALIRKALGETLRASYTTDMAQAVFHALLELRFPLQHRAKATDWHGLARTVEAPWIGVGMSSNATTNTNTTTTTSTNAITTTTSTTSSTTSITSTLVRQATADAMQPSDAHTAIETDSEQEDFSFVSVVHPATEASLAQLILSMKVKAHVAEEDGDFDGRISEAARSIVSLLEGDEPDMSAWLEPGAGAAVTTLLLEAGEWRLLRHLVPSHPVWHIDVSTPEIASNLAAMAPWPSPTSSLHLTVPSTLSISGIQTVATLASATPRENLALSIEGHVNAEAVGWNAVSDLVNACPCASLRIVQDFAAPGSFKSLGEFLGKLMPATVGELVLLALDQDESEDPEALDVDLVTGVRRSGITALRIVNDSNRLVKAMAISHPWSRLAFNTSPYLAADLENQTIVTQTLSLGIANCHNPREILHIVNACKGLKTLDLWGAHVDIEILATILRRAPSITTLRCDISARTPSSALSTLALLSRNTTLQRFMPPSRPGYGDTVSGTAPHIRIPILELTVRNQFLHAQRGDTGIPEFAIGAVSGLAQTWQLGLPDELSLILAGMLDTTSAKNLSAVNTKTYLGSRRNREMKILALAHELASHASAAALAGSAPTAQKPLLAHIEALRMANTSTFIIRTALGRRLHQLLPPTDAEIRRNPELLTRPQPTQAELDTVPNLLEAMAYIGALPTLQWLKEGFGVDA